MALRDELIALIESEDPLEKAPTNTMSPMATASTGAMANAARNTPNANAAPV